MARQVTRYDDIIDSRDVIKRIEELTEALEETETCVSQDGDDCTCGMPLDTHDTEEAAEELAALKALEEEASSSPDWPYGETLIRDSYFREYAEQLADDIGAIDPNLADRWPYTCIDWEAAARELKHDYQSVDFDGVTYWIRY